MWLLAVLVAFPQFVDRAEAAGLRVVTYCGGPTKDHILESTGNGVLVLDYDQDGFPDVYFVNAHKDGAPQTSVLYRNLGDGTFDDVTERAGVTTSVFGQGGAVGDIDDDGLPDLYVTAFDDNQLFRNNGDGTFSDWTARAGVAVPTWSIGAVFFDADGDGDEDLYVSSYIAHGWDDVARGRRTRAWRGKVMVLDGPKGLPPEKNHFFQNQGDGTFLDKTESAGLAGNDRYSMGVLAFDFDGDADLDLYVANDSSPNYLYRNRGNGTFEDIGIELGAAYSADGNAQGSMGVAAGDVDGDGFLDLVVTNFAHDYYALYRNLEGRLFLEDSFTADIALATFRPLGWGVQLFDADNDRDLDLFFANGQIYPQVDDDPSLGESYRQPNQMFRNDGGRFVEVTGEAGPGLGVVLSSRGSAQADFDRDGDLDIVISNEDDSPTYLLNEGPELSHWLSLDLRGASTARVELDVAGRLDVGFLSTGGSYASANERRVHFGLGDATRVEKLEILWPDGARETHRDVAADRSYIVKRGQPLIAVP